MNNVMIDLETLGKGADAAIIAIGAVAFDIDSDKIDDGIYIAVDLETAVAAGGVMDPSTVLWWFKQTDAARLKLCEPGFPILVALGALSDYLKEHGPRGNLNIWGNGAAFDNVILASAYQRAQLPVPWDYWNDRCYRTLKNVLPGPMIQRSGTHHNALDDAISQAQHLQKILGALKQIRSRVEA